MTYIFWLEVHVVVSDLEMDTNKVDQSGTITVASELAHVW